MGEGGRSYCRSDATTDNLSSVKIFLSKRVEVLKFLSLGSYALTYKLSYYWHLDLDTDLKRTSY